jgi:hypothetical protein
MGYVVGSISWGEIEYYAESVRDLEKKTKLAPDRSKKVQIGAEITM